MTNTISVTSVEAFMPHGMCLLWRPDLLLTHVISDSLIALSYFSIPVALLYFVIKRQDLRFRWIFVLFGTFIMACGTTHLFNIWTIWHPDYFSEGLVKTATALVSIATAILLWPLIPLALKLPSPTTLEHANLLLQQEILERERHENQISLLNAGLEKRVEERTQAWREANRLLAQEIQEREQAEEALKDADRRKDEFLAMLGHELRNPITPIATAVEILNKQSLDAPTMNWVCDVLNRNVNQVLRLVDDLLDVSRITRGLINVEQQRIELNALLQESVEAVQSLIQSKQQTLDLQLPEAPLYVNGDRVRLVQVFSNLLNNAAKYTADGGHIELKLEIEGSLLSVRISDNGMGLAPELLPYIFDLFAQGERSLARSEGGLGIGLTLVKRLVELHGGHITAHSQGIDQGSTFIVRLPRLVEGSTQSDIVNQSGLPPETGQGLKVLLIDDNQDVLTSVSMWLTISGHQVEITHNGTQGILVAKDFKPDVIVVDIGLPDLDGYHVVRKLRDQLNGQQVLILALSGYAPDKNDVRGQAAGIDHYLIKPPNLNQLRQLIADYQSSKHH